jgi:hypothetical protein
MAGKNQKDEKNILSADKRVFCRLVAVEKIKPAVAYAQVFGCKENSAATLAGRLLKKVEIVDEIQRLSTSIEHIKEKAAIWTKAERMEKLQAWADQSVDNGDIPTAIKCVDTLNKMDGAYQPKQDETQGAQQVQVSPEQMKLWAQQIEAARQKVREQAREKGLPTVE